MVMVIINGRRIWKDIEELTAEEKQAFDSQINRPSEAQMKAKEQTEELKDLMSSPARFKQKLQRLNEDD